MANSKQAMTSLLTEHFRYTPLTLLDDIINTVNELVYRAVNAVEEGLSDAPARSLGFADRFAAEHPDVTPEKDEDGNEIYPASKAEIENGVHQLETLLQAAVDKNFDKLEIYVLRNILTVPEDVASWVRLAHYENLTFPPSIPPTDQKPQEQQPTTETLHLLRRKLTESRRLENLLVSERSRNEVIISQLQALLHSPQQPSLSFLTSSPAAKSLNLTFASPDSQARLSTASTTSSVPPTPRTKASATLPLTTHTRFLVSQLPALRQLVSTLRASEEGGALRYARPSGAADERREYIEARVRKQLEAEGVDVAGGTGAATAMGRKLRPEEVSGIEGIAEMLSAGRERRDEDGGGGDGDAMEE